jgi:hypothetical protein
VRAPLYYEKVVTCTARCPVVQNCNVDRSLPRRYLPRGTTSRCQPGSAPLMVVLANPGKPLEIEDEHYAVNEASTVANAAWAFTEAVLERQVSPRLGARRSATHDVLMRHLADDVFGCPMGDVLDRVVVTNAVRCSTPRNFSEYLPDLQLVVGTACVTNHLVGEVQYWRPKLVVGCGKPVREIFTHLQQRGVISVDFVEAHHPIALGRSIAERKEQFKLIGEMLRAGGTRQMGASPSLPSVLENRIPRATAAASAGQLGVVRDRAVRRSRKVGRTMPTSTKKTISTQREWQRVRVRFPHLSDYQSFSPTYSFNPTSTLRLTGKTIREALPRARVNGPRWAIFEHAIQEGATIERVNARAKKMGGRHDADIFIALHTGFVTLQG